MYQAPRAEQIMTAPGFYRNVFPWAMRENPLRRTWSHAESSVSSEQPLRFLEWVDPFDESNSIRQFDVELSNTIDNLKGIASSFGQAVVARICEIEQLTILTFDRRLAAATAGKLVPVLAVWEACWSQRLERAIGVSGGVQPVIGSTTR